MVCPCCGAELRGGVRYCTTCGVAVHGLSTVPAFWVQSRKHVVVVLVCMLTIALAGGSWLGFQLYRTMSCFISTHSEHAIVLDISAAGWDTDNGASRVPIHITGKTVDGITVDEVDYVASNGSGISLIQGVYTLEAAGSPIAVDGTIYQIPCTSATLTLDDVFATGETIDLAELAEQDSILTFRPIDAGDMTNDEIYNAALLAMAYKGNDAPNVAVLCQAAINRRAAASTSGNAFKSCGEIGSVLQVKRANQSLFHRN